MVALAAIATVAAAVWLVSREDTPAKLACDVPIQVGSETPAPATAAPGGGGVRVVEKGFTQVGPGGNGVSLGAVLENTSGMVAYRTRIALRAFDAQRQPATWRDSPQLIQEVPIIIPGQRIGAGSFAYVADRPGGKATVASMEIELQTTRWLPPGMMGSGFTGASGAFERIHRFDPAATEPAYIDYTVTVSSCRALTPRSVAAVYRNAKGVVIGGTLEAPASRGQGLCEPGRHSQGISADGLPPTVDPPRTEFYPYCDISARPVVTTDPPWN
jgi:hypothetical protein